MEHHLEKDSEVSELLNEKYMAEMKKQKEINKTLQANKRAAEGANTNSTSKRFKSGSRDGK